MISLCPLSGVFSPVVWNDVVHELLKETKGETCNVVGYADDLMSIVRGVFSDTL